MKNLSEIKSTTAAGIIFFIAILGLLVLILLAPPAPAEDSIQKDFDDSNLTKIDSNVYFVEGQSEVQIRMHEDYRKTSYDLTLNYANKIVVDDYDDGIDKVLSIRTVNKEESLTLNNSVNTYSFSNNSYIKFEIDKMDDEAKEKYKADDLIEYSIIILLFTILLSAFYILAVTGVKNKN